MLPRSRFHFLPVRQLEVGMLEFLQDPVPVGVGVAECDVVDVVNVVFDGFEAGVGIGDGDGIADVQSWRPGPRSPVVHLQVSESYL